MTETATTSPHGNGSQGSQAKKVSTEVLLLTVGAMLTLLGAAATSVMTYLQEGRKWERETEYSIRTSMFNKRIELLERIAKLLNGPAEYYATTSDISFETAKKRVLLGKESTARIDRDLDAGVAAQQKIVDLRTEYGTTLNLALLYFGPKTQLAINELESTGFQRVR